MSFPDCPTCGDTLHQSECPRCDWGGWNTFEDATKNPQDPTLDSHRGIQAALLSTPLDWGPGVQGKGILDRRGQLHTWQGATAHESFRGGHPAYEARALFYINPDGRIHSYGNDLLPEHAETIMKLNPQLHQNTPSVDEFRLASGDEEGYQGWANWDTWNTKLMMDNEYEHYLKQQQMGKEGWTPEQIRDWAIPNVIGPHNKRAIEDAREWNEIPEHDRLDHNYENLKDKSPEAADIVNSLGFGPDVSDEEPTLMDPELVDWQDIHRHINNDHQEQLEYDRQQMPNPPPAPVQPPAPDPDQAGDLTIPEHWSAIPRHRWWMG